MNTLGSHPGAILFRFSVMAIIILILIVAFFRYTEGYRRSIEELSIVNTKKIIDSALTVVFTKLAVSKSLEELNDIDGANPFVLMQQHEIAHSRYQGLLSRDPRPDDVPGWYYLPEHRYSVYKARYLEGNRYFRITLQYDDLNRSGRFESSQDRLRSLLFSEISPTEN